MSTPGGPRSPSTDARGRLTGHAWKGQRRERGRHSRPPPPPRQTVFSPGPAGAKDTGSRSWSGHRGQAKRTEILQQRDRKHVENGAVGSSFGPCGARRKHLLDVARGAAPEGATGGALSISSGSVGEGGPHGGCAERRPFGLQRSPKVSDPDVPVAQVERAEGASVAEATARGRAQAPLEQHVVRFQVSV